MPNFAKLRTHLKSPLAKTLFSSFRPHLPAFALVVILSFAGIFASSLSPKILWQIVDLAVADFRAGHHLQIANLLPTITFLISLYAFFALSSLLVGIILAQISAKYTAHLRSQVFTKIHHLPMQFYDQEKTGEIITIMTEDTSVIGELMAITLYETIKQIFEIAATVFFMATISLPFTAIAVFSALIVALVSIRINRQIHTANETVRRVRGHLNSDIEEFYASQVLVHANAMEGTALSRIDTSLQELADIAAHRITLRRNLHAFFAPVITYFGSTTIFTWSAFLVLQGKMTFGSMQALTQYAWRFTDPISGLTRSTDSFQQILTSARRIFKFLALQDLPDCIPTQSALQSTISSHLPAQSASHPKSSPKIPSKSQPNPKTSALPTKIHGRLTFQNLTFDYQEGMNVFKNLNLTIPAGSKVAIVGPTGSGKTTLVSLLMRFYDYQSGAILIDDIPIHTLPRQTVRSLFGMVLQDSWLSPDTVLENLTYGNPTLPLKKVQSVAKLCNLHHFIETLPSGYHTVLNEDASTLSAGERQLLTIARAMIADPPMLILDEATSNVDTRTEKLIQDALKKLMQNRTSIIIAHRLSTIIDADLIIVLKKGRIIEQGTHSELLQNDQFYAKLYNSQFDETPNV